MKNNKPGIKSKLKEVPETMLITLRAKYQETKSPDRIINDPKSVEILEQIDYDFSGKKQVKKTTQKGIVIRTEILDELTGTFLSNNKNAVVVSLGCGLDSRFQRINKEEVTRFDLDLPDAIELRKNFFEESKQLTFIPKSILDFSWTEVVPKNQPTLFIAEGLLMYFTEKEVKSIIKTIGDEFPGSEMIFDAMPTFAVNKKNMHPDVKNYEAQFKWGIKTGKEINQWNMKAKFLNEYFIFDRYKNHWPFFLRVLMLIPAFKKSGKIIHLKFTTT